MPAPLPPVDASFISSGGGWRHGCLVLGKSEQHFVRAVGSSAFSPQLLRSSCNDAPKLTAAPSSLLVVRMVGMESRQLSCYWGIRASDVLFPSPLNCRCSAPSIRFPRLCFVPCRASELPFCAGSGRLGRL